MSLGAKRSCNMMGPSSVLVLIVMYAIAVSSNRARRSESAHALTAPNVGGASCGPRAAPARPFGCCQRRRLLSTKPGLVVGMREVLEAGVSWTVATRAVARCAGSGGSESPAGGGYGRRPAAD